MDLLQWLIEFDESMLLTINGIHNKFFDHFMYLFSGKTIWMPMYVAILYVMLRNFSLKTTLFCLLSLALTIVIADQLGASVIRPWVERLRPSNPDNPISGLVHLVDNYRGGRYGFPSCHAANSFGLAFFVCLVFRDKFLTAFFIGWAVVTSYSRIYLGVHYPGDVIVGILLGLFAAWAISTGFFLVSKYQRPDTLRHLYTPVIVGSLTILSIAVYATCSIHF